ncbi:MAG: urease accessory protein UreD [Rhizobiaceae bacterium]|nr:urease accessory protein UreD [Rhizobiaceae bacterium]
MYASTSPSDSGLTASHTRRHQRVDAAAAVSFKHNGAKTSLDRLYQQGSAKIRFPKHYGGQLEAVLINTAGGLTGGDQLGWHVRLGESCEVVATTQACEKSYESSSGTAHVQTSINLAASSTLHWLPQETILYDGSALARSFDVEMDEGAELLAIESIMLGREAMGEELKKVQFHDRWRVRQSGKLVFADDLRLEGLNNSTAGFDNLRAATSLLFLCPLDDEALSPIADKMRAACSSDTAGFSAFEGKITGRILASDTYELRKALIPVLKVLRDQELPRVWRI